ncbi:hypothetical protein SESBI_37003, partial [Sesbania bispinosa]
MERGIEATKSGVLCKTRVAVEKHLGFDEVAVPRRRHQPLAGGRTSKRIPHLSKAKQRGQVNVTAKCYED